MKPKKYQVVTCIIALYAAFMTIYFGLDLLREGHALRFWLTLGAETVVIIFAYFALRRRDRLRKNR